MNSQIFRLLNGIWLLVILGSCQNNQLLLKKVPAPTNFQVDTLETYHDKGLLVLGVTENRALGRFRFYYVISKKAENNSVLYYKVGKGSHEWRLSNDYVSIVQSKNITNWGWFNLKDGKIDNQLPAVNKIVDSLKRSVSKDVFIKANNGYISYYNQGKVIKVFNYGNFVRPFENLNFDSLRYGLYQLTNDSIKKISSNGNDLTKQKEGIFFVPSPGFGVVNKFEKKEIFEVLDSVSKMTTPPHEIKINPVQRN